MFSGDHFCDDLMTCNTDSDVEIILLKLKRVCDVLELTTSLPTIRQALARSLFYLLEVPMVGK